MNTSVLESLVATAQRITQAMRQAVDAMNRYERGDQTRLSIEGEFIDLIDELVAVTDRIDKAATEG